MSLLSHPIGTTLGALVLVGGLVACGDTLSPTGQGASGPLASERERASESEIELETELISVNSEFPDAHGEAEFEDHEGERELEIEVEGLSPADAGVSGPPPGLLLSVAGGDDPVEFFVDGVLVGTSQVDDEGGAEIELSGEVGDAVPAIHGGSVVTVTLDGVLVVRGVF